MGLIALYLIYLKGTDFVSQSPKFLVFFTLNTVSLRCFKAALILTSIY